MSELPTDRELIRLAGYDPSVATVLATAWREDVAAVLIDTNGDGRLVDFQGLWRDETGWHPGTSHGAGSAGEGPLSDRISYRYRRDERGEGESVIDLIEDPPAR